MIVRVMSDPEIREIRKIRVRPATPADLEAIERIAAANKEPTLAPLWPGYLYLDHLLAERTWLAAKALGPGHVRESGFRAWDNGWSRAQASRAAIPDSRSTNPASAAKRGSRAIASEPANQESRTGSQAATPSADCVGQPFSIGTPIMLPHSVQEPS